LDFASPQKAAVPGKCVHNQAVGGGDLMKALTCKELGGKCDQRLTANTWDEMVKVMTKHVMDNHPDVAKAMEKMHKEDPQKWGREMRPKWEAAPEV
jgi:hypothetical protein